MVFSVPKIDTVLCTYVGVTGYNVLTIANDIIGQLCVNIANPFRNVHFIWATGHEVWYIPGISFSGVYYHHLYSFALLIKFLFVRK